MGVTGLMSPTQDLRLLAETGWRMAREDPAWLAVQAARRFLPTRLRAGWASGSGTGLLGVLGAFVGDRADRAAVLVRRRGVTGLRLGDGLAARVAVLVGAPDALAPAMAVKPEVAAALATEQGDISGALTTLATSRGAAARKLRAEWRMLQPGFRLPASGTVWAGPGDGVRVLHVLTNSLPHTRSGYTRRTHELLKASQRLGVMLEAVTRIGYPTTVGVLGAPEADVVDGIVYRRLKAVHLAADPIDRLTQQVDALVEQARRVRPGILHTTTDFTNALVTQAAGASLGIPWVYEMRGQLELSWVAARAEEYRSAAEVSERVRLLRDKEAELAGSADAVVVLSEVQQKDMVMRGVDPRRIIVVPNAIDPGLLERKTAPREARRGLGLPEGGIWVGTVSSLVAYEGLDQLLRAVALLRADGLDVRVLVVGDGVSRPSLIGLAEELGLEGVALFPGAVPSAEAPAWFEALDVFVVPRKDTPVSRMVTPLKPVEAMALGRPVVASDLPALREVTAGGAAGGLFPADDFAALAAVLGPLVLNDEDRQALGTAARAIVQDRTWAAGASTLLHAYERLGR